MDFPTPLVRGTLIQRYKRFLADVRFEDGHEETIHCPNPGSMLGLAEPGLTVWASHSSAKARKLPHTLELVETAGAALVSVNTMLPNRLVAEALREAAIPELSGYATARPEVKYGEASRVDFLLEGPGRAPCWVEVKGVTLARTPGLAEWPDCVSARATRHLAELVARTALGERAVVLFVTQRPDCNRFTPATDLDPAFSAALLRAKAAGVEVLVYGCAVSTEEIRIAGALRRADPT
jgi:sugar fermentation stimulation protein A